MASTVEAATPFAAGHAVPGMVSAKVATITEGVLEAMLLTKLKFAAGVLVAGALLGIGAGLLNFRAAAAATHDVQPAKAKDEPKPDPMAAKLVEQLGSPAFREREGVAEKLRELGLKAVPALEAGTRSTDLEVRRRCEQLLAEGREGARDALTKAFQSDGTDEPDHPVWRRFKSVAGNDRTARNLFAEIIADPRRLRLLDDAQRNPDRAGELYQREVARLAENTKKSVNRPGPLRGGPIHEMADDPMPRRADVAVGFYLGTFPATAKAFPDPNWDRVALPGPLEESYGLFHNSFQRALDRPYHSTPPERAVAHAFCRLFAAWLSRRENPGSICLGLDQARAEKVAEVLPTARAVAADARQSLKVRAAAVPILGAYGSEKDEPLLIALLDEKTVYAGTKYNPEQKDATAQVRDMVLASLLARRGKNPGDFGFPGFTHHLTRRPGELWDVPLHPHYLGFFDDDSRVAAHKKAREWLEKKN